MFMLAVATVVWGLSFPLIKDWMQAADAQGFPGGPPQAALTLIAVRMLAGALVISLLFPRLFLRISALEFLVGFSVGVMNSFASLLQVWGMQETSPALSAFFTSLGSPLVPVLSFLLFRTAAPRLTLVGLMVGTAGVFVLSRHDLAQSEAVVFRQGDLLTLLAAFLFAVVIICLSHWGKHARAGHLVLGMLMGGGVPAVLLSVGMSLTVPACAGWWPAVIEMFQSPHILVDVTLLILLPTVTGAYCMTTYQPQVLASRAALIYLLEPVFGALASLAWGHDQLSISLVAGGVLIVGGNFLAELPGIMRSKNVEGTASRPLTPPSPPEAESEGKKMS
jgi:drug/metabolite transporter (DMT)-like permease